MFRAQVSSKGQVVIPKRLRDKLGIAEGSVVTFSEDRGALRLSVQADANAEQILDSLQAGHCLAAYSGPRRSIAEMREGVRGAFRRKPR